MAVLSPPGYVQAGVYSALLDRIYQNTATALRSFPSTTISAKSGFWPAKLPSFAVVSGMDVVIGPCAGIVANGFIAGGGDYAIAAPSNTQVTLAGSSPTLNRNDIIGFYVRDNFYDSSGLNQVTLAVLQGANSAGAPTDPAMPPAFLPVCRAVVSAGAISPVLQGMISRTVPEGGLLQIGTDVERTSLGTPYYGFPIMRTDQFGLIQVWNGTNWWSAPNPPYANLRQTVNQNITQNTFAALVWDAAGEDLDNFGGHTNTSRYTCQRDGVYGFMGAYVSALNGTGFRQCRWAVNGAVVPGSSGQPMAGSTVVAPVSNARPIIRRLAVGDYVELQAWQNSGAPLGTFTTAELQSSMSVFWIAP